MTSVSDFYRKDCDKIPASCVNAYIDLMYDPENPTGIILDHSWGNIHLDLLPLIKAGETVTSLELTETSLKYNREDGGSDCIHGDDLSRIISMKYLKDVTQEKMPENGDIYIYDGTLFQPFDFVTWKNNIENKISLLQARMTAAENQIANHEARIKAIELKLTPPADAPSNVKVTFGNINLYSDYTNSNGKNWGLYTHLLSNDIANDEKFA